jgi:hypothetical protein
MSPVSRPSRLPSGAPEPLPEPAPSGCPRTVVHRDGDSGTAAEVGSRSASDESDRRATSSRIVGGGISQNGGELPKSRAPASAPNRGSSCRAGGLGGGQRDSDQTIARPTSTAKSSLGYWGGGTISKLAPTRRLSRVAIKSQRRRPGRFWVSGGTSVRSTGFSFAQSAGSAYGSERARQKARAIEARGSGGTRKGVAVGRYCPG